MGAVDNLFGFGTALGRGVVSVAQDMYWGAERTADGLGFHGYDRIAEIGLENEYLVNNLTNLVRGAITLPDNPLYKVIAHILEKYYHYFPEFALEAVAKAAAVRTGFMAGRTLIGKQLAGVIAVRIATEIAATAAYKQLATKIGVSAASGSTGVGVLISLVMTQGMGQRASRASVRLRMRNPTIWMELRTRGGLDMLYFLVEGPMAPYLDAIELAQRNYPMFEQEMRRLYTQKSF